MGILEKVVLVIYSFIVLVAAIVSSLLIFGWISPEMIENAINLVIKGETSTIILLVVNIIFVLLSIK